MTALAVRDGYRLWAPDYERETAISFLEDRLVASMTPPLAGLRLLDAGCGTGRRLREVDSALAAGVDLTPEMLAAGAQPGVAAADVRALPFPSASWDVVWCRLVIGHLASAGTAYAELARVCRPGGTVIVTDFHADAFGAGHRRTFRDAAGTVHEVEHHVHLPDTQVDLADAAGLDLVAREDGAVGDELRPFYERAGKLAAYEQQLGLPIVLALAFRRR